MNALPATRRKTRARWLAVGGLTAFAVVLLIGTARYPHFWLTADQHGDVLFRRRELAAAAKAYADPWRIAVAQYRNGDFAAAAKTFARVSGAAGAFDAGNAWLMHGQYDAAIASYDRALGFRRGWREAEENKALAAARKANLVAAGEDREEVQTDDDDGPDKIVFDQKGGKNRENALDLNGEQMSDEAIRAAWLRRVQTTPGDFLRAKFAHQAAHPLQQEAGTREEKQ